jgi:hypothetical protein
MGALCTGQGSRRKIGVGKETLLPLHFYALVTQQVHVRPPMNLSTPVMPEKRFTPDNEGMQQDTDLARLYRRPPIPLALLAQWTGTATANAGPIHHTQGSVSFSALLMRGKFLVSRATYCPIGLQNKVLA